MRATWAGKARFSSKQTPPASSIPYQAIIQGDGTTTDVGECDNSLYASLKLCHILTASSLTQRRREAPLFVAQTTVRPAAFAPHVNLAVSADLRQHKAAAPHHGSGIPLGRPCPLLGKPLRRKVDSPSSRGSFPTVITPLHSRRDHALDHHDASDQAR